jgi:HPt (histidine-containing phosphotransfer) domain-containing protein
MVDVIEAAAQLGGRIPSPRLSPATAPSEQLTGEQPPSEQPMAEQAVDRVHLARMTLGDARLQAEVLALFDRQAGMLLARMRQASPAAVGAFAHTLKGSARGIGAWRVAAAAELVERSATSPGTIDDALDRLAKAVAQVRSATKDLRAAS